MSKSLLIKLTAGTEELEKCSIALTVAAASIAAGNPTSVWLTGDAVFFATPDFAEKLQLPEATPFAELRDTILSGGQLTACTQCVSRRGLDVNSLLTGVRMAGATAFVEEATDHHTQAIVY